MLEYDYKMPTDNANLGLAKPYPFALKGHGLQSHALETLLP
jgi:hypothetical protein